MIFRRKKPPLTHLEADKAIEEAQKHYDEVKARDDEVHEIASSLKHIQKRNHFSERIEAIMEGKEYREK